MRSMSVRLGLIWTTQANIILWSLPFSPSVRIYLIGKAPGRQSRKRRERVRGLAGTIKLVAKF